MTRQSPIIRASILSGEEEELLAAYTKRINPKTKVVEVRALGRFGYSGAKLLLVSFDAHSGGIPFVVKLRTRGDIVREYGSIVHVQSYFPDALPGFPPEYHKSLGAITYRHFGANRVSDISKSRELRDLVVSLSSRRKLAKMLGHVYRDCCLSAHSSSHFEEINLEKEYRRYLRKHQSRARIEVALGRNKSTEEFRFLGAVVYNPLMFLELALPQNIGCCIAPVHGDLHANNVVLDAKGSPHLIDFAWAQTGHVLKDFVLMESSLRFLLFPRYANLDLQCRIDESLLEEDGVERARKFLGASGLEEQYLRLLDMVEVIRSSARAVAGDRYTFSEFLLAQFVVLYGLLRYEHYNTYSALRYLGMLARKLRDKNYPV